MRTLIQWLVAFFWIALFNLIGLLVVGATDRPEMALIIVVIDVWLLLGSAIVANGERR